MTTPLTNDKERALVDEIGSLQNKIKEHEAEKLKMLKELQEAERKMM